MLHHPTHDRLAELGLHGAAAAFADLIADPEAAELDHAAWLGLLLDPRGDPTDGPASANTAALARLRHPQACPEDIDYRTPRGLGRTLIAALSAPDWIKNARTTIITGPTGVGKVGLPVPSDTALPQRHRRHLSPRRPAVRGAGPRSWRRPSCPDAQQLGQDQAVHPRRLRPRTLSAQARHDLFEILEDRYGRTATIVVSQLPVERWHEMLGDPTIADAILDRLVHTAYRIELKGDPCAS